MWQDITAEYPKPYTEYQVLYHDQKDETYVVYQDGQLLGQLAVPRNYLTEPTKEVPQILLWKHADVEAGAADLTRRIYVAASHHSYYTHTLGLMSYFVVSADEPHFLLAGMSTELKSTDVDFGKKCKCGCGVVAKDSVKRDLREYVAKHWYQAANGLLFVNRDHAAAAQRKAV